MKKIKMIFDFGGMFLGVILMGYMFSDHLNDFGAYTAITFPLSILAGVATVVIVLTIIHFLIYLIVKRTFKGFGRFYIESVLGNKNEYIIKDFIVEVNGEDYEKVYGKVGLKVKVESATYEGPIYIDALDIKDARVYRKVD